MEPRPPLELARRLAGRKSAGAAAISSTCGAANRSAPRVASSAVVSTSIRLHSARRQHDVGGDKGHLSAAACGRVGQRQAHPSAGAIADVAHRVDRLPCPAGGDQDAQTVPRPPPAAWPRPGRAALRLGSRPTPCSPRDASAPSSGSITLMPRSRSVARLAWVAASRTCGRSSPERRARRRAGQERRRHHRVGDPGRELGDRVRRGRGDQEGVGVRDHLEVADRVVRRAPVHRGRRRASGRARTRR